VVSPWPFLIFPRPSGHLPATGATRGPHGATERNRTVTPFTGDGLPDRGRHFLGEPGQLTVDGTPGEEDEEDGRYESPFTSATGRAEIRKMFIDLRDQGFTAGKRHMTGPAMIDVNGTRATARSWYWVAETEQAPAVYATGTYTDELQKIEGQWKIVHRVQTLDPSAARNQ
jgi:hypothetical protein